MAFEQELQTIQLVVERIEREAIKAAQRWAKANLPAEMRRMFDRELYADLSGRVLELGRISPGWRAFKARFGLDSRRGHATGALAAVMGSQRLVKSTAKGFDVDVLRASAGRTTTYPSDEGPRRVTVSGYVQDYARRKAPTLGQMSTQMRNELERAVLKSVEPLIRNLRSSVAITGYRQLTATVETSLNTIGVRAGTRAL